MKRDMLPVAILCGGLGTRMRAIAADLPKALIPVAGEPFVFHQLRWLRSNAVDDVVLCVGFGAQAIADAVGDGRSFGLNVRYSADGDRLRGTAGSLANALPLLGPMFLTMYGDSLLTCDPRRIAHDFAASADAGLMTVLHNEDRWQPSNVCIDGDRVTTYDKQAAPGTMTHIDYGLNAFTSKAFVEIDPAQSTDLAVVHRSLVDQRRLRAYPVSGRFFEIGSPQGLAETEEFLAADPAYGGRYNEHI